MVSERNSAIKIILLIMLLLVPTALFTKLRFTQLIHSTLKIKNEIIHKTLLGIISKQSITSSLLRQHSMYEINEIVNIWVYLDRTLNSRLTLNSFKGEYQCDLKKLKISNIITWGTHTSSVTTQGNTQSVENIHIYFSPIGVRTIYVKQLNMTMLISNNLTRSSTN